MANLNGFNANEVEPVNEFEPLPEGNYIAVVAASEFKESKKQTGQYLELQFQVIEGEYKGRQVWARLCLYHPKELTAKIANNHLADICRAVGVTTPRDSAELHNLPLEITVKVKKRTDNGELTNEIKKYAARPSAVSAAPQTKPNVAPWRR